MNDYLPETCQSTISLDVMNEEFDGAIPNARVMVKAEDQKEAIKIKEEIADVDGVSSVTWIDDIVSDNIPLSMYPEDTLETYYKDGYALFKVTIDEDKRTEAVNAIYDIIGDDNSMSGSAVSTAVATQSTVTEVKKITIIAIIFLIVILMFTTTSWLEPFIILIGLGVAIIINSGSNLIFGEIPYLTGRSIFYIAYLIISSIQLGATVDYAILLTERYKENREKLGKKESIIETISNVTVSILTSGLTLTFVGLLLGIISTHGLLSQVGFFMGKGTLCSMVAVLFILPCFLYVFDGICVKKKTKKISKKKSS